MKKWLLDRTLIEALCLISSVVIVVVVIGTHCQG